MAAQNLPVNFPIPPENAIASYNFTDIAVGNGIIRLYPGHANAYVLSNNTFYSDTIGTEYAIPGGGAWQKGFDYDYDMLANKQMVLKGVAISNIPYGLYDACNGKAKILLRKWDGATETEIVSAESAESTGTGAAFKQKVAAISLTVPETVIKKGEYIRVTIELYGKNSGGSPVLLYCQDPMSRVPEIASWSPVTITNPIIQLPIKIEL